MSEHNGSQDPQDTNPQEESGGYAVFDRGSLLSIFESDRREDFIALLLAFSIALGVYVLVS